MALAVIIDIILAIVLIASAFAGLKKGFIKSISVFVEYIFAFAFANALYKYISVYTIRIPFIANMITDIDMPETEAVTFMDKIKQAAEYIFTSNQSASDTVKAIIDNYVAEILANVLAFAAVFIISLLILKLVMLIVGQIFKTPGLKQINGVLGFVFGAFIGLFWTWILSNAFVNFALPLLSTKWPNVFTPEIAESFIVQMCLKVNPMTYLFTAINWFTQLFAR